MITKRFRLFVLFILVLLCSSCTSDAKYDIRGTWRYTSLDQDGNVFDEGTIHFEGSPGEGQYSQRNYYEIKYEGVYVVKESTVIITGDEIWRGTFTDNDHLSGTWVSGDDAFEGTWTALRAKADS